MSEPLIKLPDDRLVIALDFGTTYSGVAYAFNVPGKQANVTSILDWPGKSICLLPFVPPLYAYPTQLPSRETTLPWIISSERIAYQTLSHRRLSYRRLSYRR